MRQIRDFFGAIIGRVARSDRPSTQTLEDRLSSSDAAERRDAITEASKQDGSSYKQHFYIMLDDSDEFVRVHAAKALGGVGDTETIPILEARIGSVAPDIQYCFSDAILQIRSRFGLETNSVPAAHEDTDVEQPRRVKQAGSIEQDETDRSNKAKRAAQMDRRLQQKRLDLTPDGKLLRSVRISRSLYRKDKESWWRAIDSKGVDLGPLVATPARIESVHQVAELAGAVNSLKRYVDAAIPRQLRELENLSQQRMAPRAAEEAMALLLEIRKDAARLR